MARPGLDRQLFYPTVSLDDYAFTLLRKFENGRPRSRANDHIIREDVATNPIVAQIANATMIDAIAVLPRIEAVAWTKTSMKGNPVGESKIASISPRAKRVASNMAKPRQPFTRMLIMIERGTTIAEFSISSDILEVQ